LAGARLRSASAVGRCTRTAPLAPAATHSRFRCALSAARPDTAVAPPSHSPMQNRSLFAPSPFSARSPSLPRSNHLLAAKPRFALARLATPLHAMLCYAMQMQMQCKCVVLWQRTPRSFPITAEPSAADRRCHTRQHYTRGARRRPQGTAGTLPYLIRSYARTLVGLTTPSCTCAWLA
jgi:hypothetical protein